QLSPKPTLIPYTTLFRSRHKPTTHSELRGKPLADPGVNLDHPDIVVPNPGGEGFVCRSRHRKTNGHFIFLFVVNPQRIAVNFRLDRKSTRLNSSHVKISY